MRAFPEMQRSGFRAARQRKIRRDVSFCDRIIDKIGNKG